MHVPDGGLGDGLGTGGDGGGVDGLGVGGLGLGGLGLGETVGGGLGPGGVDAQVTLLAQLQYCWVLSKSRPVEHPMYED